MIVTISDLISQLNGVVGKRFVITSPRSMERFCKGYRSGGGKAIAVVCPGHLIGAVACAGALRSGKCNRNNASG